MHLIMYRFTPRLFTAAVIRRWQELVRRLLPNSEAGEGAEIGDPCNQVLTYRDAAEEVHDAPRSPSIRIRMKPEQTHRSPMERAKSTPVGLYPRYSKLL